MYLFNQLLEAPVGALIDGPPENLTSFLHHDYDSENNKNYNDVQIWLRRTILSIRIFCFVLCWKIISGWNFQVARQLVHPLVKRGVRRATFIYAGCGTVICNHCHALEPSSFPRWHQADASTKLLLGYMWQQQSWPFVLEVSRPAETSLALIQGTQLCSDLV